MKTERLRYSTIFKLVDRFIPGNNIPSFLQTRSSGTLVIVEKKGESHHIEAVKLQYTLSREDLCWSTCCIENRQGKTVNYL